MQKNSLLTIAFDDKSDTDDDSTAFGNLPHTGEHFTVDISNTALFFDADENKLKTKA